MPHLFPDQLPPAALLAGIAALCIIGGLLPFTPMEAIVAGLTAAAPPSLFVPALLVATTTQMFSKVLLYVASSAGRRALAGRQQELFDRATRRLTGKRSLRVATTFASAVTGLPPFYAVTVAYGALRLPMGEYIVTGTLGRVIRMAALVMMGRAMVPVIA